MHQPVIPSLPVAQPPLRSAALHRRTFLGATAWGIAAPWMANATAANTTTAAPPAQLAQPLARMWVWDARCAQQVARAWHQPSAQAQVCTIDSDVSHAWFSTLRPHLQQPGAALAGISQGDTVFCLQRLAMDMGWQLQLHPLPGQHSAHALPTASQLASSAQAYAWSLLPTART